MFYFVRTPKWLQQLYKSCIWKMPTNEKVIYLTFDDGPHPAATNFVLDILNTYHAKGTFFCIGKNVMAHPEIYNRIIAEGHAVGNHTYNHLNGWKTNTEAYVTNIMEASKCIATKLFRPPYGRITTPQLKRLPGIGLKPIMWTVLSGDFDTGISNQTCLQNVLTKTTNGSIVVFHDSEKAYLKLAYTLPKVLDYFIERGYRFEKIEL